MDQTGSGSGSGLQKRMEALSLQASALRDALQRSEENTDSAVAALDSFDRHVSAIEASIRPAQVRAQASTMANENIDRTIETAEAILAQFEIVRWAEAMILRGPHEDLKSFLEGVDLLIGVSHFVSSNKNFKSYEGVLNQVNNLLTKFKLKIQEEVRQLMSTYSKASEPAHLYDCLPPWALEGNPVGEQLSKSSESATYRTPTLIPPRMLPLLHDIAHQLVQDGNQQSCHRIDRDAHSSALELSLQKLGIEKLTKDNMQQWVASNIGTWTHILHITVKVLLAGERKICDQISDSSTFNKDQCFAEVAGSSVMTLHGFGDVVAKSKISHENLFLQLDMYGLMHGLKSEVEVTFQGKFCSGMREAALNLAKSLPQAAQETLVELEVAVEKDNSKTIVQNGNLHPFTIEVMNYVKGQFDCQSTLKILFQQPGSGSETESQLSIVTMKIMQAFQNNLNVKSKQYKDPALSHIFLMNNLHYMVTSVRRSESKDILGGDWIQRHCKIVQKNANQYKRVAWVKGLRSIDTLTSSQKMSLSAHRDRSEARRAQRAGCSKMKMAAMLLLVLAALLPAAGATGASSGGRSMRGAANQLATATTSHGAAIGGGTTAARLTCDAPFMSSEMIKLCRVRTDAPGAPCCVAVLMTVEQDCLCRVADAGEFILSDLSVSRVWHWYQTCGGRRRSVPDDDDGCEPGSVSPPPPPAKPEAPSTWPPVLWIAVALLCAAVVATAVFVGLKLWLPREVQVPMQTEDQGVSDTPVITGLPQMATGLGDVRPCAGEKSTNTIKISASVGEEEEARLPVPPRVKRSQVARPRLPCAPPFEPLPPAVVQREILIPGAGPPSVVVHVPETVISGLPPESWRASILTARPVEQRQLRCSICIDIWIWIGANSEAPILCFPLLSFVNRQIVIG